MDSNRFDAFARALAASRASRREISRGLFASAVASVPVFGAILETEAGRRRKRRKRRKRKKSKKNKNRILRCEGDSCDGTGGKACGGRDDCQCYRYAKGGNVCASSMSSSTDPMCDSDKDCPRGHVCIEGGPACGGRGLRFCKAACYK